MPQEVPVPGEPVLSARDRIQRSPIMAASAKRTTKPSVTKPLTRRKAWIALKTHHKKVSAIHLRKLFEDDPNRGEKFTAEAIGIYLDYSKKRINDKTLKLLLALAKESGLQSRIDA